MTISLNSRFLTWIDGIYKYLLKTDLIWPLEIMNKISAIKAAKSALVIVKNSP